MLSKLFYDTETCGFHGMPVLLQHAVEDGPIELYSPWLEPIRKTLTLIEWYLEYAMVGFNIAFDHFHLTKLYTTLRLCPLDWIPGEHVNEIALLEPKAMDGPCIKPASACDLLLHSRRNEYQALMARDDIRIRRVPSALAFALAQELEARVKLPSIYFARAAEDAPRWHVYDRVSKKTGRVDNEFKDVVLRFSPAGGLKYLAEHALGHKPKAHFADVEVDKAFRPVEYGYAPTALAVSTPEKNWAVLNEDGTIKGYAWPGVIHHHIRHWAENERAREYAKDDIVYTRELHPHFGSPEPGDDDSVLACMVASIRWRGFTLNIPGIESLMADAERVMADSPVNINKPSEVRKYITEFMDDMESIVLEESTCKAKVEEISNWNVRAQVELAEDEADPETAVEDTVRDWKVDGEECAKCFGAGCARCNNTGRLAAGLHPAAVRAKQVLDVKAKAKEKELYAKLLHAGRFHTSFKIIGAKSNRMSGDSDLNPQGIKHADYVRQMFPLAWDGYILSGGDFDAFEVSIADAVTNDPELRKDLQLGKKIHGLFAQAMYPGTTYEEVTASKGTDNDLYDKGKKGFFGTILYGGNEMTLKTRLGVAIEDGKAAIAKFLNRYFGIKKWREGVEDRFCSIKQPGGIGSQVIWTEPSDYVESFLGFRRYFTLENRIAKAIYELATKPPKHWKDCKVKVLRRDRVQTAAGAVASALYGAAFGLQAANMRAAANHEIQSPGATITKFTQRRIWDIQPAGVHEFLVAPMNIHDEILTVHKEEVTQEVADVVHECVEGYRAKVPLIGVTWVTNMTDWSGKKG